MRMPTISLGLVGLLALTSCKTANFKGDTGTKSIPQNNVENPTGLNPGNSVVTTNPDGSTTTTTKTADGIVTTVTKNPDGTLETITKAPDGTTTTAEIKPDGTKETSTTKPDGTTTVSTTTPDGTTKGETKSPDGTKANETKTPDGTTTTVTTKPDGTVTTEVKKPDGTTTAVVKNPDGSTTTVTTKTNPNGSTTTITKKPDGTTTTVTKTTNPDGTVTTVTKHPNGTTTTVTTTPSKPTTDPGKGGGGGKPTDTFVNCPEFPDRMLVAGLYKIPAQSSKLPNFATTKKEKDVCLKQLDVIDRNFEEGFPGIANLVEWFALDINWRVNIPEDGTYTFYINSDDGSRLFIDGKQVIDNDGLHEHLEKSGKTTLNKGWHNFKVTWYQGPRYRIALELFWKRPSASKREYIPTNYFARPTM